MKICIRIFWHIIVNYMTYSWYIYSSCDYISSNENILGSISESINS